MKTKYIILAAILAASAALQTAVAENKLPAPKPEFKTQEELVKWSEEKTKEAAAADSASAIRDSQFFYTGKPYLEESGTYAFLFRQYDPELSRWTSADPSGFPDGANNVAYVTVPTSEFDWQGLKSVAWVVAWTSLVSSSLMESTFSDMQASFHIVRNSFVTNDSATKGTPNATHYLDDGDSFDFFSIGSAFDFAGSGIEGYDRIYLAAHGNSQTGKFYIGDNAYSHEMILGFAENIYMLRGCGAGFISTATIVLDHFEPSTREFLDE